MKKLCLLWVCFLTFPVCAQVVINEVDADQTSTDTAEFVELFGTANQSLDGLVLVFYNGNGDVSYQAFDLDGQQLDGNGFFVLCGDAANVPNCDMDVGIGSNLIQNGPDAVALYVADATDFPTNTAVTATNLVDALVYDTSDSDDAELLSVLTPGQAQINEDGLGSKDTHANARVPDGGSVLDTSTYTQQDPTPGTSNSGGGGGGATVMINEFVANHTGTDTHEFIEVFGEASTDYSTLTIVQLEGDTGDGPGLIDTVYSVGSTDADGFWTTGFLNNELGGGTKTLLLVDNFSGTQGQDLDATDDGTLDAEPWDEIIDAIAVNDGDAGDLTYATPVLDVAFGGGSFAPGGASRIPNGTDTNTTGDWVPNDFDGAGLPGFPGTLASGEALNTPGIVNTTEPPPSVVINEFLVNHVGTDTHEFLEVYGTAGQDFSNWWLLQVDSSLLVNLGTVHRAISIGTTDPGGYWSSGFLNEQLLDTNFSLLLVEDYTGIEGEDLDTNDDGVLDTQPWTQLHDSVGIDDGGPATFYTTQILAEDFGSIAGVPGGASRIPNGTNTGAISDWKPNDFDGEGLPGFMGTLVEGEAVNTPGAFNSTTAPGSTDAVINEWVANHTGSDEYEFVEIFASPSSSYAHLWIVQLEGDSEDGPGVIDTQYQVGETDTDGYWTTGFLTNELGNNTATLLLVEGYTGAVGTDLDTNDDGTLDVIPWTSIVDSVAFTDEGASDQTYSETVLNPSYDGGIFTPGGASRFPNGIDTDATGDWLRNDFHGAGLPGFTGNVDPGEALNTPGLENSDQPPAGAGARISEFVADHEGSDTHEFVEIWGESGTSYGDSRILIVGGDAGENPGTILEVITPGSTDSDGFWSSDFQTDVISNGSITLLLVEDFSGTAGDDIDTNDDGTLDSEPWSALTDSVAIDDGGAGDIAYSESVLGGAIRGLGHPGGASRYPFHQDTDTAADWRPNNFDGEGLPGFSGSVLSGEAFNTPGRVNVVPVEDYYAGVDENNLRATLHDLIDNHIRFPYTASLTDTWDMLESADEDPLDSGNILSIYKNATYAKQGGGNSFYNREHTWPSSFGFPDNSSDSTPYTDAHHLMLADSVYNSTRSNRAYGDCPSGCSEATTNVHNGQGGGSGTYPGNSNWYQGSGGTGSFEVWHHRRGDVARAQLYMDVRYEGDVHEVFAFAEPDLVLTDNTALITTFSSNTTGIAYMGRLSTLLQWHLDDPVDAEEMARNEIIYRLQGNRNPFIDNPDWVACIFEGQCAGVLSACILNTLPTWFTGDPICGSGNNQSILDTIAQINETCTCE